MSAQFSFSYLSSCLLWLLVVLALVHLCLSHQKSGDVLCLNGERRALIRFKHGLIDEADRLASWVGEKNDCCRWAGIVCDNITGHVHEIHLRGPDGHCIYWESYREKLGGHLSPSLLELKQLKYLDLSCNDFNTIPVPSFMGSLRSLKYLNLSESNFGGMIPSQIGNISELRVLSLSLYGTSLMKMQWLSSLRRLRYLDMSYIDLSKATDWFHVINTLPSLVVLHLFDCQLSDTHPHVSRLDVTSLSVLDISRNYFGKTSIPRWIFSLTSLVSLNFGGCSFDHPHPPILSIYSFHNLTSLETIYAPGNYFMNSSSVLKVDGRCHRSSLCQTSELEGSTWRRQQLNPKTTSCKLDSSILGAELDYELLGFGASISIMASITEGFIGTGHKQHKNFITHASRVILEVISQHNYVRYVAKSYETLSLVIPATLDVLDLRSNVFTGKLPSLSNSSLMPKYVVLSNNSFVGSLHHFLCFNGVEKAEYLSLGYNHLSGAIPECWDKWSSLQVLKLENNNLSGEIPRTFGSLLNLTWLNMHGNMISRRLPSSLRSLSKLVVLQLGRNELVGSIPTWIGTKLTFLSILNIRFNNLDGNIPDELCYLSDIQILDLADNNLSGNIPRCFNNFSNLNEKEANSNGEVDVDLDDLGYIIASDTLVMKRQEYTYGSTLGLVKLLDLSSNNLSGHVPSELTALQGLQTLNLSKNQLIGRIPENIGDMKALESLDLSMNKLSGELPISMSMLNFLSNFNVSYNNLTGRIPVNTQLQSLNKSSFFGNKLCGVPLIDCYVTVEAPTDTMRDRKEEDGSNWGLIISIVLGFVTGFWIIVAPLVVSTSWRIAYLNHMSKLIKVHGL